MNNYIRSDYDDSTYLDEMFSDDIENDFERSSFLITESTWDSYKEKISEIIQKIIKAIKEFCLKVKIKVNTKIQQMQVNKKLEELKTILAKKRDKIMNKQFNYFDFRKYKKFYKDFINKYIAELKVGLNKDFKNAAEYEKWRESMMKKLSEFNFKLTDEEQWRLSTSINDAIKLTEEETKNREHNIDMIEKEGSDTLKDIEKYYKKIDIEGSHINFSRGSLSLLKSKNSLIGYVCSQIAKCIKTIVKFITKHLFACITGLIVLIIAV